MKKIFLIVCVSIIGFMACNSNKVFEKHTGIDNNSWNRFKKITFEVPIEDTVNYNVSIAIRYIDGIPYSSILVGMTCYTPAGEEKYNEYKLNLRDEKTGLYTGVVAGDIWDVTIPVIKNMPFYNKGTYKFEIENLMPKFETPGIMEVGLIVEKTK